MANALHKTMVYLGLADDNERDAPESAQEETIVSNSEEREDVRDEGYRAPVTPIGRSVVAEETPVAAPAAAAGEPESELTRITTIHPRSYNDAKAIGESFRDGIPVIMNVSDLGESEAKRLIDFSAGLVFGLDGSIERVTSKVFLLSPSFVEVINEEKPADSEARFFNQS